MLRTKRIHALILVTGAAGLWTGSVARAAAPAAGAAGGLKTEKMLPASGASDVCVDAPLKITFSAVPAMGTAGKIQIFDAADNQLVEAIDATVQTKTKPIGGMPDMKYFPVIITGNQAVIYPAKPLAFGKSYYVTVDPGFFAGQGGITGQAAWKFTTKKAAPAAGSTKLNVAADGSGDFCTLQGALDFIPQGNTTRTTVFIKKGTYNEIIFLMNKNAITLLGEDRKQTIIAYSNNEAFNKIPGNPFGPEKPDPSSADPAKGDPIYHRGMFTGHRVEDLCIANLTLHNTTRKGGSQAEAIILNGTTSARAILANVDLSSFQDTLQINGQAYLTHCYIEGDTDFMWGTGPVFFDNCECKSLNTRTFYTQIRNQQTNHGFVYSHCLFDGADNVSSMLSRIATNKYPASEVVLIDCTMTGAVSDVAWSIQGGAAQVNFAEYNSHKPNGEPVDVSKRLEASKQLKMPADAEMIRNYSNPAWVLGNNWTPKLPPDVAAAVGGVDGVTGPAPSH